jgi:hypothetical protein
MKILISIAVVGVMLFAGLAVVAPSLVKKVDAPQTVNAAAVGPREVTTKISNMFESYLKSSNYADRGKHTNTLGVNGWWYDRNAYYPDIVIRDKYPFTFLYDYYSANIPAAIKDPRMGYGIYTMYRMSMDAKNLTTIATGANMDPVFIPILNPSGLALDGGTVSWNFFCTYLTAQETLDITAGTHYANTYYGVPAGAVKFAGADYNDGWWNDFQITVTFNKAAAIKFLNLPGAGNLLTEFNTANAAGAINAAWAAEWLNDGCAGGKYNIYCTYDYQLNSGSNDMWLTGVTGNTNSLTIKGWGHAWGYEILMMRYLEGAAKVMANNQAYAENFYLNGTATSTYTNLQVRADAFYHMLAWKDPNFWTASWSLDTVHSDACPNTLANPASSWASRYQRYGATSSFHPSKLEWSPGTVNYGTRVMYWQPPLGYNLTAGEKLIVSLGNQPTIGYKPYKGTSDVISTAKAAEVTAQSYWGELVLGNCYPALISGKYDHATKTITMVGPLTLNADPQENPTYKYLNESGSPSFIFNVAKVSHYELAMVNAGPYVRGADVPIKVTAKNLSQAVVEDWNGTVDMSGGGLVFGSASHTFLPAEKGVWLTTVKAAAAGTYTMTATDRDYKWDVIDSLAVTFEEPSDEVGLLRVTTNPAVPSMIYIDGNWASPWGLNWVKLPVGQHTLSFSDVPGFVTPADATVAIAAGQTTEYVAQFVACGSLRVITSPAVPSTIYVNQVPRNDWGIWVDVPAGTYTVSFGAVKDYATPASQTVTLTAGGYQEVTGVFTSSPGSPAPDPATYGMLRLTTNPALPSMIYIDGNWASPWGLNWVKLSPGTHTLSWSDVPAWITPASEQFTITAGQTTTIDKAWTPCGSLRVITSPAVPSTVYVNGIPRNDWGLWADVPAGTYTVTFGDVAGYVTPAGQTVTLTAGGYQEVTGVFVPG